MPLTPGQPLLLSDCRHLLAQSAQGGFLARQIALEGKDLEDLVLDPAGRIIHRRRLGHYDLFNHHLRIDRGEAFFYLAGNPPEQHQDKGLFRLDPQTFKTREVLRLSATRSTSTTCTAACWAIACCSTPRSTTRRITPTVPSA